MPTLILPPQRWEAGLLSNTNLTYNPRMGRRIYVETVIQAPLAELWQRTQDPELHVRWDLRFSRIIPETPPHHTVEPQRTAEPLNTAEPPNGSVAERTAGYESTLLRFQYQTSILPGLTVSGTGVHAGERRKRDGSATSALRFSSDRPISLIRTGSGYWRYIPHTVDGGGHSGVTFLTGYDYTPRWGRFGQIVDSAIFRPAIGWATAFSFDRLRLWLEDGITPERSRNQALIEAAARVGAAGAAALLGDWRWGLGAAAVALLTPPLPSTPSARRCRRRPVGRERRVDVAAALSKNSHGREEGGS